MMFGSGVCSEWGCLREFRKRDRVRLVCYQYWVSSDKIVRHVTNIEYRMSEKVCHLICISVCLVSLSYTLTAPFWPRGDARGEVRGERRGERRGGGGKEASFRCGARCCFCRKERCTVAAASSWLPRAADAQTSEPVPFAI